MRFLALVAGCLLLLASSSLAARPDKPRGPKKPPSSEPTPTPTPTPDPTPAPTPAPDPSPAPPPSGQVETVIGKFIVKCGFSHRAQVDPIVNPGQVSAHLHDFYGNTSTDAFSTLGSMLDRGTTCSHSKDTAAYWAPTLLDPQGRRVEAVTGFTYYRNRPLDYGPTVPFPPDFRMIAGGEHGYPENTFWNCFKDDSSTVRHAAPPHCADDYLVATVFFPNCWDGKNIDSPDHRAHVVHPTGNGPDACPASHPVKLPDLRFFQRYPKGSGGPGWRLSDGTTHVHADFWNTWDQPVLEQLVRDCLNAQTECDKVTG